MILRRPPAQRHLARAILLAGCIAAAGPAAIAPAQAQTAPTRPFVQHLLRRFAFAAPPETVTAVIGQGVPAWLAQQENPGALDDSASTLEVPPTALNATGGYPDWNVFERMVMQHMVLTPRQLQAKLELHWLDHFAVSLNKVGDPAIMYHYDQTVRSLALGNFTTLMQAVAREPAMLIWLDNNWNVGPVANENFAREAMQLYTMGTTQLNLDGSVVVDSSGTPVPTYTQGDVQNVARAITGYGVNWDSTDTNPETRFATVYYPPNHYTGTIHFLGMPRRIPTDGTAIDAVISTLCHQPSVAPFMVRELLQRFATETPSPQFIADIAAVWQANVDAPDQIAQVINAIAAHPQFAASYHAMPKQPTELMFGALRQLPGMMQATASAVPAGSLQWELGALQQQLFYPPSVFSFYRPGGLLSMTNSGSVVTRTWTLSNITSADPANAYTDTFISIPTLRARIGSTAAPTIRDYLADALLDGGTDAERQILLHYLGPTPSDARLQGAMWLLLNAPDYAVN